MLTPDLVELYLRLHAMPEVSGHEAGTAALLAGRLRAAGLTTTTGVGGHGLVGVLRNGPGETIALRAELDALPIREDTGLSYASRVEAMHACGHDAHLACLVGAVTALAARRTDWQGTLVVVGQPAEETMQGAEAMLTDGLYRRFPRPNTMLAQHLAPLPAGVVAHGTGPMTTAAATVQVMLHGRGGHAGLPGQAVNPIELAAAAVIALARLNGPDTAVTVGSLTAGTQPNVVPESAALGVSVRAVGPALLTETLTAVTETIRSVADAEIRVGTRVPDNVNDPARAALVRAAHRDAFGAGRVLDWPRSMAAEDFGWYGPAGVELHGSTEVRTVYWMLGCLSPRAFAAAAGATLWDRAATFAPNHSPRFAPDPVPTLRAGITALYTAAVRCFGRGAQVTAPSGSHAD